MYPLLKKKIERKSYKTKDEMQVMLDNYYFMDRISNEEYSELSSSLVS